MPRPDVEQAAVAEEPEQQERDAEQRDDDAEHRAARRRARAVDAWRRASRRSAGCAAARSAGAIAATTVTTMPTTNDQIDRGRGDGDRRWPGCRGRARRASALRPAARRMPPTKPMMDATSPTSTASNSTEPSTWRWPGTDRAQQRHLAAALGDDDREGVEDDERADEQRDDAEDEQERVEEREVVLQVALALLGDLLAADHLDVLRCPPRPSTRLLDVARRPRPARRRSRPCTSIASNWPGVPEHRAWRCRA